jgi:parallel beta-helix repeat protein
MRRRNYRNADGIILDGTGSSGVDPAVTTDDTFNISLVEIKDNMVAYSSNSGITVRGANDVVIQDNTLTLNRANGIAIGDDDANAYSSDVSVVGNEITRSGTNGVYVGNGSAGIDVGTTIAEEGNRIGTNNSGRRGLGNRANGVYVDGAGASVSLAGNLIMSNGARRTTAGRSGIKLSNQSDEVVITENNISMNRDAGIEAETVGTKATITKNTIFRNYGSGIKLTNTAFADLVVGSLTPTGVSPTDQGNTILSNRRYGIDASGGAATVGGNVMLGNRRGGIDSQVTKPTISTATLTGDDLTVTLSAIPANGDIIHLYLGTGRRSRSQGYRYIGSITGDGALASFDLTNLDAELRVRVGSSLTATTTPVAGGGVSEFSDNVSIRRP